MGNVIQHTKPWGYVGLYSQRPALRSLPRLPDQGLRRAPFSGGRPGTEGGPAASSHTPNRSRLPQNLDSPLFSSTEHHWAAFYAPPSSSWPAPAPPAASPGPQPSAARQAVLTPPPPVTHGLLGSPGAPGHRGPGGPGARPHAVASERGGLQGDELGAGVQEVEGGPPAAAVAGSHAGRAGSAAP